MIILASKSPRRVDILTRMGYEFEVTPSNERELMPIGALPNDAVKLLAHQKAKSVAKLYSTDDIIIGADTVVSINNQILGKPKDEEAAKNILETLSGAEHIVYTGICVIKGKTVITDYESTSVFFKKLTSEEIKAYIKTGEPMDKAGAYGIQERGCVFVKKIIGDYFNVCGLPAYKLNEILKGVI